MFHASVVSPDGTATPGKFDFYKAPAFAVRFRLQASPDKPPDKPPEKYTPRYSLFALSGLKSEWLVQSVIFIQIL
jgi:hypothetical protein